MITPAQYEDAMKDLDNLERNNASSSEKTKLKALTDTVDVLKQFGYDCGAEAFLHLMRK